MRVGVVVFEGGLWGGGVVSSHNSTVSAQSSLPPGGGRPRFRVAAHPRYH